MPKIKVNDINLYYETHGHGEPIVFIGGFTRDHNSWINILDTFAAKYQVIIFDNRGAGQSDCPDAPYTIKMMADDTAVLCKALGIHSAHFIGGSMGGMILQDIAYRYADLVKSAVIVNSGMKMDIKYAMVSKARLVLMEAKVPMEQILQMSLPWVFSSKFLQDQTLINEYIKMELDYPFEISNTGFKNQLHALLEFDSSKWSNKISVPCLVTGSDQDLIFPELEQRALAQSIPDSLYHCFFNVGHAPTIEVPKEFVELALGYLSVH